MVFSNRSRRETAFPKPGDRPLNPSKGGGGDIFKAGAGIGVAGLGVSAGIGLARGTNPKILSKENQKDRIKKNTRGRK